MLNLTPPCEKLHLDTFCTQVIDEADRMMDEFKHDWLSQVEACVYTVSTPPGGSPGYYARKMPEALTVAR